MDNERRLSRGRYNRVCLPQFLELDVLELHRYRVAAVQLQAEDAGPVVLGGRSVNPGTVEVLQISPLSCSVVINFPYRQPHRTGYSTPGYFAQNQFWNAFRERVSTTGHFAEPRTNSKAPREGYPEFLQNPLGAKYPHGSR